MLISALLLATAPAAWAAEDDIFFGAALSADEQSAPTESPGSGIAEFRLERDTLRLSWKVTFKDLTSPPIEAGLYGPENVGGNAGLLVDLAPKGLKSPLEGSVILSDGDFQYLITTRVYVNIMTTTYKDGELRGQVRRLRAKPVTTN
ncbi:MAG: CHRD domain-containing protein [Rhodospirillaceae bacterium]|nr:CHRD domain-containing protein [Rhodospirillaceae bacterium]